MQNLKKMSVSLDSLPLDDIGFCDNWSYTFIGCFFLFVCLLFLCKILKKMFVHISCLSYRCAVGYQ